MFFLSKGSKYIFIRGLNRLRMASPKQNSYWTLIIRFIIFFTFGEAMDISKVINRPGVRYFPGIPFAVPGRRSFTDFDREFFLHKLEQRVSDQLDDIDNGRSFSQKPSFMSYEKKSGQKLFAAYEKRSHHNLNAFGDLC